MINLALRTEYSFQEAFGKMKDICASQKEVVSIADNNTFGFYKLQKFCKQQSKKPLFGLRVMVVKDKTIRVDPRGQYGPWHILIAKNNDGVKEIFDIYTKSTEYFFYRSHISYSDLWQISNNVFVISDSFEMDERLDYIGISFNTPKKIKSIKGIPHVAIQCNRYINPEDKEVYELFAGCRKMQNQTYPQHIIREEEFLFYHKDFQAIENTFNIANECNAEILKADRMKYIGNENFDNLCLKGAFNRKINLNASPYKERFEMEVRLIKQKDFVDYFMIVQEIVSNAKKKMLVGPGRGSSGGSLVAYLLGITEINPIEYGLLFERFIDVNRDDSPDIDIDFPDNKRQSVIQDLINLNGEDNVAAISTLSTMKPRASVSETSKELMIRRFEVEKLLDSLVSHASGDSNFGGSIRETLETTEIGTNFLERYPKICLSYKIEGHIRHKSVHASGILVTKNKISEYCATDLRTKSALIDGKDSEEFGLLKIDILGISTLQVLEETAKAAGFEYKDFYRMSYNDDKVFKLFRDNKLYGVFQFEGFALKNLCKSIKVRSFDDIISINALSRPGPLQGGQSRKFASIHSGDLEVDPLIDHPIVRKITENTFGQVVFQEQLMQIIKQFGNFSWQEVTEVRKACAKTKGKEFFVKFRDKFVQGGLDNGVQENISSDAWEKLILFGGYAFNKSHAAAYAMISYWCAWCKTYYPLEFSVAYLNTISEPKKIIKYLYQLEEHFGIKYIAVDPNESLEKWSIKDGKLLGGLTNIKGIGLTSAKKIVASRKNDSIKLSKSIKEKLIDPKTEIDTCHEAHSMFKEIYSNPRSFGLSQMVCDIKNVNRKGNFTIIGKLIKKKIVEKNNLHHLNLIFEDDTESIMARISTKNFEKYGMQIIEEGVEDESWYIANGDIISDDVMFLFIKSIGKIQ